MTDLVTAWSLAGLTTDDGRLDRTVSLSPILLPTSVALDEDRLVWDAASGAHKPRYADASATLLSRFVRLVDASSTQVRDYAREFGVLGMCHHRLPATHHLGCAPRRDASGCYFETLDDWRWLARKTRAILDVAAWVHQDFPLKTDAELARIARAVRESWPYADHPDDALDVETASYPLPTTDPVQLRQWLPRDRHDVRALLDVPMRSWLMIVVNCWLAWGATFPSLDWIDRSPRISLGGQTLVGALAVQLVFAVCRADGFATCSGCGQMFAPNRRPRANGRSYCPTCREKAVPLRDAQRDCRARRQGTPVAPDAP